MEQLLRDRIADLAQDAPTQLSVPPDLTSRSHRRAATVIVMAVLVTGVVALGAVSGVRALIRAEGPFTPTNPGTGVDLGSAGAGRITVVTSGHTVLDVDPESGSMRTIELPTFAHLLAWSPDGSRLLFSDVGRLDVLEPDGSIVTVERTGPADASEGSWSPDGTRIVYMTDAGEKDYPLRVVHADGSGLLAEFGSETTNGRFPAWSPDGSSIAFIGGAFDSPELWLIGADGSDPHVVIGCDPSGACPIWSPPTWSPDGTHLAFAASGRNGDQIYVVRVDGSNLTRLTDVAGSAIDPSWSPDGTQIAFIHTMDTSNTLELMDADGSNIRSLGVEAETSFRVLWHIEPSA